MARTVPRAHAVAGAAVDGNDVVLADERHPIDHRDDLAADLLAGSPHAERQGCRAGIRHQAVAAQRLAGGIHEHGPRDPGRVLDYGSGRIDALVSQGLAVFRIDDGIPDMNDTVTGAGGGTRQAARVNDLVVAGRLMFFREGEHVGRVLDFLVGQQRRS